MSIRGRCWSIPTRLIRHTQSTADADGVDSFNQDELASTVYELWRKRGSPHGSPEQDLVPREGVEIPQPRALLQHKRVIFIIWTPRRAPD